MIIVVSFLSTLILVEVFVYILGYSPVKENINIDDDAVPIYYRGPTLVEEGFKRRPGPDMWQGKVLSAWLKYIGVDAEVYKDEAEVVIEYDEYGFRNPDNLRDWDIVVVGDSFVELGYLPHHELFTTQLGRILGKRVKNLGVSYTGPLTYTHYLKEYGRAESTEHAILCFFEGNDIDELIKEEYRIRQARERKEGAIQALPTSVKDFILHVHYRYPKSWLAYKLSLLWMHRFPKDFFNSSFIGHGPEIPVTISYAPLGSGQLTQAHKNLLGKALYGWSQIAHEYGMKPWLVYLPSKHRVLHGQLRYSESADRKLTQWQPTDLPSLVKSLAEASGFDFIDVSPALISETQKGNLTYNTIADTHLNRKGSDVVAREIARAFIASGLITQPSTKPNLSD